MEKILYAHCMSYLNILPCIGFRKTPGNERVKAGEERRRREMVDEGPNESSAIHWPCELELVALPLLL